jgi:hypothetical protein
LKTYITFPQIKVLLGGTLTFISVLFLLFSLILQKYKSTGFEPNPHFLEIGTPSLARVKEYEDEIKKVKDEVERVTKGTEVNIQRLLCSEGV